MQHGWDCKGQRFARREGRSLTAKTEDVRDRIPAASNCGRYSYKRTRYGWLRFAFPRSGVRHPRIRSRWLRFAHPKSSEPNGLAWLRFARSEQRRVANLAGGFVLHTRTRRTKACVTASDLAPVGFVSHNLQVACLRPHTSSPFHAPREAPTITQGHFALCIEIG
jgi:hypothetical protein